MTYSIYLTLALATAGRHDPESAAETTPHLPDVLGPALGRIRDLAEGLRKDPLSPRRSASVRKHSRAEGGKQHNVRLGDEGNGKLKAPSCR